MERSKKKVQPWKKAILHFLLCFIMGFFTGIAPMGKSSMHMLSDSGMTSEVSPQPVELSVQNFNESSLGQTPVEVAMPMHSQEVADKEDQEKDESDTSPKRLIVIVTPTSAKDQLRELLLSKLANTLKLVPPPLLWIVVEQQSESSQVSEILRKTGVMYRHLVFTESFSNLEAEMDYQKNVALNHMEHHKLSGIVHFAGLSNVYDLSFFSEIRTIEVFGTWPMALVSANRKRVTIEGAVCNSAEVIGWHLRRKNNNNNATEEDAKSPLHISSFAFNSSILWDPERWGRVSSVQDTSQNSIKFVEKEVLEGETDLRGIPAEGCSRIMLWNLHLPIKPSDGFIL
ncbi:beta-1,4-xylosyltransferase IRX9-like [Apium graveolens]|uniref:beta-1,4-xylosyltransferase IRX9-like n=1 Tax=Apium graveolens TaxID=4045 RepID=UPI003D7B4760